MLSSDLALWKTPYLYVYLNDKWLKHTTDKLCANSTGRGVILTRLIAAKMQQCTHSITGESTLILPNEDNFEETGPVGWKGFKRQFIAKLNHKSETSQ